MASLQTKTPVKAVEEDDFEAAAVYADVAAKTGDEKAARRISALFPQTLKLRKEEELKPTTLKLCRSATP